MTSLTPNEDAVRKMYADTAEEQARAIAALPAPKALHARVIADLCRAALIAMARETDNGHECDDIVEALCNAVANVLHNAVQSMELSAEEEPAEYASMLTAVSGNLLAMATGNGEEISRSEVVATHIARA